MVNKRGLACDFWGFKLVLVISDPVSHSTLLFLSTATFRQQKQKYVHASAAQVCCLLYQSKTINEDDLSEYPRPHVATAEVLAHFFLHFCYRSSLGQRNSVVIHCPTAAISKRNCGSKLW